MSPNFLLRSFFKHFPDNSRAPVPDFVQCLTTDMNPDRVYHSKVVLTVGGVEAKDTNLYALENGVLDGILITLDRYPINIYIFTIVIAGNHE